MKLGEKKELEVFKQHAYKTSWEIGQEYNFDKVYKDKRAVTNAVYAIYNKVKNNPGKYGIDTDTMNLVLDAVGQRKIRKNAQFVTEPLSDKEMVDIGSLVSDNRDRAARILNKKLISLEKSQKKMENISFKELTTAFGIMFDKGQLLKGEATEHIAHYAKIEKNMDPVEALKIIQDMREANAAKNDT